VQLQRDVYRLGATTSTSSNPAAMSPANADPPPRNTMIGGYVDLVWDARDDLRITPGLRFDVYDSTRGVDGASGTVPVVEPRLSARWRILSELSLLVTAGIAHQYPLLRIGNAPPTAVAVPGFWAADRQLQRAQQASAGAEWLLPGAFTATATGFGSVTYGLTDLQESCDSPRFGPPNMQAVASCGDTRSTGIAYGIELSLRRPLTERLAGWLSYTLSRATERTRDAAGTQTLLSTFDRTHVASASVAYQVSAGWRAGARIVAYTGAPLLVPASADGTVPASQLRLPWFERVDLRAERRWNLAHDRSISLVFDLLNATLSREYNNVTCAAGTTTCTLRPGGPFVVPSIGVEGGF
jgi:outer membrane receptor protein involved in Fe transport